MISGEKLKKLRLMRNLTQKELAIKSGLTDAAIRNYELGNRSPSKDQLQKIAEALECDISALINHDPNSIFEIMHIIFDYEKDIKFRPLVGEGETTSLLSNDTDFNNFLIEWDEMRKKHYNGEISDEEFEDWKLSFPKKSRYLK
ncbi:helix-turn-helix domain-containing protein [Atopobacter sp. AH10]|uniref:helix-turn-helix domain-containing protein n=1 Tax=Atopobacter sp. AH10 TaxID=2315861 RepID=UPI000EF238EE|nr:helix-turn-helix domain-containing protein [Atopobacter sp. AH10]